MTPAFPRAVLFDLDNTLVHRARSIAAYARRFCADFGAWLRAADAEAIGALLIAEDHGGYLPKDSPHATIKDAVASALSLLDWTKPPGEDALRRHWADQLPVHSVEMPGAAALVERLAHAGLRIGIVSNGAERSRAATLAALPWHGSIDMLLSSERAGCSKPDARIFQRAAHELGVDARDCWFVGDHPVNDIEGAAQAGMTGVWLAGFHHRERDARPLLSIASLDDLAGLIERSRRSA